MLQLIVDNRICGGAEKSAPTGILLFDVVVR